MLCPSSPTAVGARFDSAMASATAAALLHLRIAGVHVAGDAGCFGGVSTDRGQERIITCVLALDVDRLPRRLHSLTRQSIAGEYRLLGKTLVAHLSRLAGVGGPLSHDNPEFLH
jgi:hypothetical protein